MPGAKPSTSASNSTAKQSGESNAAEGSSNVGASKVAEKNPSIDYIHLRVINSDMTSEVHFRVKPETDLGRLKRSYCKRLGLQLEELRFVFDGYRIADEDTPKSMNMVNNDVIEIYQERSGGM